MFRMGGVHSMPSDFVRVVRFDCAADVTLFKNLTDSRTPATITSGRGSSICGSTTCLHVSKWLILLKINLVNRLEMDYIEIVRDAQSGEAGSWSY